MQTRQARLIVLKTQTSNPNSRKETHNMKRMLIPVLAMVLALSSFTVNAATNSCTTNPLPDLAWFVPAISIPVLDPTLTPACSDYAVMCEDSAMNTYRYCAFFGLGDCICKAQRQYNKCMSDMGCSGISAAKMQEMGCTCLNKSCVP